MRDFFGSEIIESVDKNIALYLDVMLNKNAESMSDLERDVARNHYVWLVTKETTSWLNDVAKSLHNDSKGNRYQLRDTMRKLQCAYDKSYKALIREHGKRRFFNDSLESRLSLLNIAFASVATTMFDSMVEFMPTQIQEGVNLGRIKEWCALWKERENLSTAEVIDFSLAMAELLCASNTKRQGIVSKYERSFIGRIFNDRKDMITRLGLPDEMNSNSAVEAGFASTSGRFGHSVGAVSRLIARFAGKTSENRTRTTSRSLPDDRFDDVSESFRSAPIQQARLATNISVHNVLDTKPNPYKRPLQHDATRLSKDSDVARDISRLASRRNDGGRWHDERSEQSRRHVEVDAVSTIEDGAISDKVIADVHARPTISHRPLNDVGRGKSLSKKIHEEVEGGRDASNSVGVNRASAVAYEDGRRSVSLRSRRLEKALADHGHRARADMSVTDISVFGSDEQLYSSASDLSGVYVYSGAAKAVSRGQFNPEDRDKVGLESKRNYKHLNDRNSRSGMQVKHYTNDSTNDSFSDDSKSDVDSIVSGFAGSVLEDDVLDVMTTKLHAATAGSARGGRVAKVSSVFSDIHGVQDGNDAEVGDVAENKAGKASDAVVGYDESGLVLNAPKYRGSDNYVPARQASMAGDDLNNDSAVFYHDDKTSNKPKAIYSSLVHKQDRIARPAFKDDSAVHSTIVELPEIPPSIPPRNYHTTSSTYSEEDGNNVEMRSDVVAGAGQASDIADARVFRSEIEKNPYASIDESLEDEAATFPDARVFSHESDEDPYELENPYASIDDFREDETVPEELPPMAFEKEVEKKLETLGITLKSYSRVREYIDHAGLRGGGSFGKTDLTQLGGIQGAAAVMANLARDFGISVRCGTLGGLVKGAFDGFDLAVSGTAAKIPSIATKMQKKYSDYSGSLPIVPQSKLETELFKESTLMKHLDGFQGEMVVDRAIIFDNPLVEFTVSYDDSKNFALTKLLNEQHELMRQLAEDPHALQKTKPEQQLALLERELLLSERQISFINKQKVSKLQRGEVALLELKEELRQQSEELIASHKRLIKYKEEFKKQTESTRKTIALTLKQKTLKKNKILLLENSSKPFIERKQELIAQQTALLRQKEAFLKQQEALLKPKEEEFTEPSKQQELIEQQKRLITKREATSTEYHKPSTEQQMALIAYKKESIKNHESFIATQRAFIEKQIETPTEKSKALIAEAKALIAETEALITQQQEALIEQGEALINSIDARIDARGELKAKLKVVRGAITRLNEKKDAVEMVLSHLLGQNVPQYFDAKLPRNLHTINSDVTKFVVLFKDECEKLTTKAYSTLDEASMEYGWMKSGFGSANEVENPAMFLQLSCKDIEKMVDKERAKIDKYRQGVVNIPYKKKFNERERQIIAKKLHLTGPENFGCMIAELETLKSMAEQLESVVSVAENGHEIRSLLDRKLYPAISNLIDLIGDVVSVVVVDINHLVSKMTASKDGRSEDGDSEISPDELLNEGPSAKKLQKVREHLQLMRKLEDPIDHAISAMRHKIKPSTWSRSELIRCADGISDAIVNAIGANGSLNELTDLVKSDVPTSEFLTKLKKSTDPQDKHKAVLLDSCVRRLEDFATDVGAIDSKESLSHPLSLELRLAPVTMLSRRLAIDLENTDKLVKHLKSKRGVRFLKDATISTERMDESEMESRIRRMKDLHYLANGPIADGLKRQNKLLKLSLNFISSSERDSFETTTFENIGQRQVWYERNRDACYLALKTIELHSDFLSAIYKGNPDLLRGANEVSRLVNEGAVLIDGFLNKGGRNEQPKPNKFVARDVGSYRAWQKKLQTRIKKVIDCIGESKAPSEAATEIVDEAVEPDVRAVKRLRSRHVKQEPLPKDKHELLLRASFDDEDDPTNIDMIIEDISSRNGEIPDSSDDSMSDTSSDDDMNAVKRHRLAGGHGNDDYSTDNEYVNLESLQRGVRLEDSGTSKAASYVVGVGLDELKQKRLQSETRSARTIDGSEAQGSLPGAVNANILKRSSRVNRLREVEHGSRLQPTSAAGKRATASKKIVRHGSQGLLLDAAIRDRYFGDLGIGEVRAATGNQKKPAARVAFAPSSSSRTISPRASGDEGSNALSVGSVGATVVARDTTSASSSSRKSILRNVSAAKASIHDSGDGLYTKTSNKSSKRNSQQASQAGSELGDGVEIFV